MLQTIKLLLLTKIWATVLKPLLLSSVLFWVITSLLLGYAAFTQFKRARNEETKRALAEVTADSLKQANKALQNDRERAYQYADLAKQHSYALQDSIKKSVSLLPAATRAKLSRQLLSELGLLNK